eukprot:3052636-Pyramimonas_sp.AAC.1
MLSKWCKSTTRPCSISRLPFLRARGAKSSNNACPPTLSSTCIDFISCLGALLLCMSLTTSVRLSMIS